MLCNACHTNVATQIHKTGVVTAGTVVLANLSTTGGIATAAYAGAGGDLLQHLLPRQPGRRDRRDQRDADLEDGGDAGVQLLPRHAAVDDVDGPVPPEPDRLRRLPQRLHRHDGERGDPRERRDRVHHPDLHHLPR